MSTLEFLDQADQLAARIGAMATNIPPDTNVLDLLAGIADLSRMVRKQIEEFRARQPKN